MNNIFITIFTPAYNRENTLERLYKSLLSQSCKNFEWLIVDDGSNDNTKSLIKGFIDEKKIDIKYYKQQNGGKHRAINKGLEYAKGEFFFIVDSDDFLPNNSIETISNYISKIEGSVIGVAGRKTIINGDNVGSKFPQKEFISDHIKKTYIDNIKGDLAEVFKTDILKQYKFPDFKGEKFCAEGLLWNRLAKKYQTLFFDESVYICEYLEGGLSFNSIRNRRKSPNYAMTIYKELALDLRLPLKMKIRTYINYWRFSFFNGKGFKINWKNVDESLFALCVYPLGFAMKLKDDLNDNVKINN
jgi:glycosyltransferase involved in cell wall biosynthesis